MINHRLRRWPNIKTTLDQYLVYDTLYADRMMNPMIGCDGCVYCVQQLVYLVIFQQTERNDPVFEKWMKIVLMFF